MSTTDKTPAEVAQEPRVLDPRLTYHKVTNKPEHVLYRGDTVVGHVRKIDSGSGPLDYHAYLAQDDGVTGPGYPTVACAAAWAEGYLTDLPTED